MSKAKPLTPKATPKAHQKAPGDQALDLVQDPLAGVPAPDSTPAPDLSGAHPGGEGVALSGAGGSYHMDSEPGNFAPKGDLPEPEKKIEEPAPAEAEPCAVACDSAASTVPGEGEPPPASQEPAPAIVDDAPHPMPVVPTKKPAKKPELPAPLRLVVVRLCPNPRIVECREDPRGRTGPLLPVRIIRPIRKGQPLFAQRQPDKTLLQVFPQPPRAKRA